MRKKTDTSPAPAVEADSQAVATPVRPITDEYTKADKAEAFDVRPSEPVSIIAGNRVLFMGEGLREIRITR